MSMKVETIRKTFLAYFAKHQHTVVASSSLVPYGDDTLLFSNAGMNQFKDVFLGQDKRTYTRAASAQRCVRAAQARRQARGSRSNWRLDLRLDWRLEDGCWCSCPKSEADCTNFKQVTSQPWRFRRRFSCVD